MVKYSCFARPVLLAALLLTPASADESGPAKLMTVCAPAEFPTAHRRHLRRLGARSRGCLCGISRVRNPHGGECRRGQTPTRLRPSAGPAIRPHPDWLRWHPAGSRASTRSTRSHRTRSRLHPLPSRQASRSGRRGRRLSRRRGSGPLHRSKNPRAGRNQPSLRRPVA